jgi:mannose-6-phosphate isomerase-like protein (cupin superfamily)
MTIRAMTDRVRRVVTGHDPSGKAVVIEDACMQPTSPDFGQKWSVWAADSPPHLPGDGRLPRFSGPLLPKTGGVHVLLFTLPPRFNPDDLVSQHEHAKADAGSVRAHTTEETHPIVHDPNPPGSYGNVKGASGMHATASVDCLLQVAGESVFVLEDCEVRLRAGDWLIVNGVMHSWRNDLDEPSVMVGMVYGAPHDGAPVRRRTP